MITALVLVGIALVALAVNYLVREGVEEILIFPIGVLVGIIFVGIFAMVLAWPVMLLLGAAHSHYAGIPALGFWATFFLVCAVRLTTLDFNLKTQWS